MRTTAFRMGMIERGLLDVLIGLDEEVFASLPVDEQVELERSIMQTYVTLGGFVQNIIEWEAIPCMGEPLAIYAYFGLNDDSEEEAI